MGGDLSGPTVYARPRTPVDYLLALVFAAVAASIFLFGAEFAFESTGFTGTQFLLILGAALLGSYVDIPLWRLKSVRPTVVVREVRAFWVTYRVPQYAMTEVSTTIALNVGGGLVPLIVSGYLLDTHRGVWFGVLAATVLTSLAVHVVAKYVEGVGVVAPTLLPPIAAVLFSLPFGGNSLVITAYIAGTLGTLIGADLLNLGKISEGGSHVASIGGAGKFDGIFLTGIVAVIIASLLRA
ncbi:MAG TPA: DUF1614 domain-containing protein [Nitrososphaerales archaeon]|nr:DUF1614 domain-containing protein [Nitrososphaerales archaeon]HUK75362.1 DUF1614 domain-containing protein [Nitrososphaerales archaeon]